MVNCRALLLTVSHLPASPPQLLTGDTAASTVATMQQIQRNRMRLGLVRCSGWGKLEPPFFLLPSLPCSTLLCSTLLRWQNSPPQHHPCPIPFSFCSTPRCSTSLFCLCLVNPSASPQFPQNRHHRHGRELEAHMASPLHAAPLTSLSSSVLPVMPLCLNRLIFRVPVAPLTGTPPRR